MINKGDQSTPEYDAINPNNKMPAIIDRAPAGGGTPITLFESGAILQYLAEKSGKLLPTDTAGKHRVLQWAYRQVGSLGPEYPMHCFRTEVTRRYKVMDEQLARNAYLKKAAQ